MISWYHMNSFLHVGIIVVDFFRQIAGDEPWEVVGVQQVLSRQNFPIF